MTCCRSLLMSLLAVYLVVPSHQAGPRQPALIQLKSHKVTGPEDMVLMGPAHHRPRRSLFNTTVQQQLVDKHNNLRRLEGASNMEFMVGH